MRGQMTGECLRYEKGGFRSAQLLHAFFTHTLKYTSDPHDGIVFENMLRAGAAWQITLFSGRTTHSWSGDIQIVGMGMSYSITRSGNLHSNALKPAPIFPMLACLAAPRHCFSSEQFTPLMGV